MYKNDKISRRYSPTGMMLLVESFKLKVLDELTTVKLNMYQLDKINGIAPTTITASSKVKLAYFKQTISINY